MATRAATFTAKIHTLSDYHFRIRHGILPQPSGMDIANTLKYFSQTLLSVFKDVPSIPVEMMRNKSQDHMRLGLFPNLDYKGLHYVLVQLVEIVPMMQQGVHVLGQSLLHTMVCLVPFLEHDLINTLPNLVASTMTIFPISLHKEIIVTLCNHLLPYSITDGDNLDNRNHAVLSVSSILMTVFQYSKDPTHHCQLLECLMSLKRDIIKDLLCVIAHGTAVARTPATSLLFLYWPTLHPVPYDRRGTQTSLLGWQPLSCQRENCLSGENNDAVKMCLDPAIAIGTGDHPPPLYVCQGCSEEITLESENAHLADVLLPMQQISLTCENKSCRSTDKTAVCTCFAIECACYNSNRPIRYCSQCHSIRHNNRRGGDHVCHMTPTSLGKTDPETLMYAMEAIVSLLKEAQPIADRNMKESSDQHIRATLLNPEDQVDFSVLEERRMLSRYGIYLLVALCSPDDETLPEILGRMLAMLFQWFDATAYFRDGDQSGGLLERLKSECIQKWLMSVCKSHFEVFVSCLLPHPPDYARVGGHWDTVTSRTGHIKEGFNRLFCLVPYEIINLEVWDYIMGHWMEAIRTEVPEQELSELKMLLSKVLDPEMSPLGFDAYHMYKFFAVRFQNTSAVVQEQALKWLQILCELDVVVPLSLLYSMFNDGILSIKNAGNEDTQSKPSSYRGPPQFANSVISNEDASDEMQPASSISSGDHQGFERKVGQPQEESEANISCFVLMLDILLKQLDLQEVDLHQGLEHIVSKETLSLMLEMIKAPWAGRHTCLDEESFECSFCELCTIFYQFSLELMEFVSPIEEASDLIKYKVPEQEIENEELSHARLSYDESCVFKLDNPVKPEVTPKELEPKLESREVETLSAIPIMTATVQTVMDTELHTVSLIPTEEVVKAVANAVTLSDMDVGAAKVCVAQATIVDENEQPIPVAREIINEEEGTFWQTSQGKFKFTLEELPLPLQHIYILLKELAKYEEADVLFHIMSCLKVLFLNAECLSKASREHRGFLIWSQENLLINNLWNRLRLDHSHVAQLGVQLLLHCLTLPSGADTFWKVLEENFHSKDWKIRFSSVEKVSAIARFLDPNLVYHSQWVQSSLSNAFSYLINCLDDISPHVSDRTSLYLDTIQNSTLKCLCWCLEVQFDAVIIDRPMILQTLFQLYNCLPNRTVLTWEFFLNRFDTLYLEAQVTLEKSGDIAYPKDLKNTDSNSEVFTQKLNRAHEAINHFGNQSLRSLSASLGPKLRYKRTLSAPCGLIYKQDKLVDKEKVFNRQYSAPVLKRKSSKFGVTHIHHPLAAHFPNHLFPDGHLQEQSHDEQSFLTTFHKLMELDEYDHDTLHLLIFLLMQFMSQPEHAYPTDEKSMAKTQNVVLRHLNLLLGYSSQDKGFVISPSKMRNSPVFNAYLSNLPRVLDRNFKMGTLLLPMCMTLLQYCPAPLRSLAEAAHLTYSLWSMDPMARHYWLQAVSIIVYKYRYNSLPLSKQVLSLLRIVLNILGSHNHRCREISNNMVSAVLGMRQHSKANAIDTSAISVGELVNVQDKETPPYSPSPRPNSGSEGVVVTISTPAEWKVHYRKIGNATVEETEGDHIWKPRKLQEMNFPNDVDDVEPELEAIPESPKTESPQAESLQEFIGDLDTANELMAETAVVRVEGGVVLRPEVGVMVINPPVEVASQAFVPVTSTICNPPAVEEKMVQQLQAFHKSFDKSKDLVELSSESIAKNNLKKKRERMAVRTDETSIFSSDDSEDTFVRHMTVRSDTVYIAKLVTMRPGPEVSFTETTTDSKMKHIKPKVENIKQTLHRKLEVLDAGQLETAVLRREPAVVSQVANQSMVAPYLFQPIQAHPITIKDKNLQNEENISGFSGKPHGLKRTFSVEEVQGDSQLLGEQSIYPNVVADAPWTVESYIPIQVSAILPHVPSPERLLSVGQSQQLSSNAEKDRRLKGPPPPVPPKRTTTKELAEIPYADDEGSLHQQPSVEEERISSLASAEEFVSEKFEIISETQENPKIKAETVLVSIPTPQELEPQGNRSFLAPVALTKKRLSHPHLEAVVVDVPVRMLEPLISDTTDVDSYRPLPTVMHLNEVSKIESEELSQTDTGSSKPQLSEPHVVMPAAVFQAPLTMWASTNSGSQVKSVTSGPTAEHLLLPPGVLALTDHTNFKKSHSINDSSGITGTIQRLYPSFRRSQESQSKTTSGFVSSPSPRALTKPFDSHPDTSKEAPDGDKLSHRREPEETRAKAHFRQRRQKENRNATNRKSKKGDYVGSGGVSRSTSQPQTSQKLADEVMVDRCPQCGVILEHYNDEELGLCVVILATCIHREPALVSTMLPEILHTVARIASDVMYPWETETSIYLPGNGRSVARQFLRCVLHQLAPCGVFIQLFESSIVDPSFFKTVVMALSDFNELNPLAPLQILLEGLNERKTLPVDNITRVMNNMAIYMDSLQLETPSAVWANILPQFDIFLRKLVMILPSNMDISSTLHIICSILHIQTLSGFKSLLEPFSKIVSFAIQNCSFQYRVLVEMCHLCNRAFSKERDKLYLSRTVIFELVQALKFKTNIPDENLWKLVQFVVQDAGGTLGPSVMVDDPGTSPWNLQNMINTSASECMKQYFSEALDFLSDVHTLSKIKSNFKGTLVGLNEDTLGGTLKAGIAQYLALEITRGNNRENRAINRYLPWLYNPLPAVQQGPKEFIDCIMHIRLLSWLLLGSLIHMIVVGTNSNLVCQPIPLEASGHVADHVQVILAGFAEQSKASVLHMSSLFHAFILCQLWTMYCEQLTALNVPGSEQYYAAAMTTIDFWAKVTPGLLQLLSHSKVLAEMVTLHFLSLIEALIECNSTVLAKLFSMWKPVLNSSNSQLPGHLVVRLQASENRPPPAQTKDEAVATGATLLKWVQRLQFKMGQIELQSSAATQFYSV
ncbi:hypothetical protein CHUAL_003310 [Chamberlinius hualienensis]